MQPLLCTRLCIIQKSIHCVCLLCPGSNKPRFVTVTKANQLCVASKFQGLLGTMTNCNAVYILETISWYEQTVAEREPIEMRESLVPPPPGAKTGNKAAIDDGHPSSDPGRGGVGGMTTSLGSNAAFVCLAVKTGTLEFVLFRLLRNSEEKIFEKERGRPSQPPPWPQAWTPVAPRLQDHEVELIYDGC